MIDLASEGEHPMKNSVLLEDDNVRNLFGLFIAISCGQSLCSEGCWQTGHFIFCLINENGGLSLI